MSTLGRRAVLVGAAAGALTVAGCGAGGAQLRSGVLRSEHWPGRDIRWEMTVPEQDGEPTPVVIVLHGKGGRARHAFDGLRLHDHTAATGLTVAAVDGGDGYWHARRSGVDSGAMVVRDFLPLVRRLSRYRGRVAFLGWSMGGYGSLLLAAQLGPETVGAVVAESAALWTHPGDAAAGAFDDAADFLAHDVFARARTDVLGQIPVRLDCGSQDPFVAGNRAFARALPSAELTIDEGGHTTSYWRGHARNQLEWIAAKL